MFLCQTVTNQYETDTETETKAVWLVFLSRTVTNHYQTETEQDRDGDRDRDGAQNLPKVASEKFRGGLYYETN